MANLLVIDDNDQVRRYVRAVLESAGHAVREAVDGDAGLRQFRDQPATLVLCDLIMPGREGLETIQALREESAAVRIIAISGGGRYGDPGSMLAVARALGADVALPKPFAPDELLAAVAALLEADPAA